jgi:hypothetical protein
MPGLLLMLGCCDSIAPMLAAPQRNMIDDLGDEALRQREMAVLDD